MTRNVKRFLAVSLLSLAPSIAFAEKHVAGDIDFVTNRSEYVSIRPEEKVQVAQRRQDVSSLATAAQTFYLGNWTGLTVYPGYSLTGTPNPLPGPVAPTAVNTISGYFEMIVTTPPGVIQTYYYTTNPADPTGAAKTCLWELNVAVNPTDNTCSATLGQAAYGTQGVICGYYPDLTWIDPVTCQAQVVTAIQ